MVPAMMSEMWSSMGSTIASFFFVWAIICQYSPYEIRHLIEKFKRTFNDYFNPYIQISIYEFTGQYRKRSEAYDAVETYLSSNKSDNAKRLRAEMGTKNSNLVLSLDDNEIITDEFEGVKVLWAVKKITSSSSKSDYSEKYERVCNLSFHKKYREMVTKKYLNHVMKEGMEIRMGNRQRKLYSNCSGYGQSTWSYVVFEHPATFETMAMDYEKKQEIMEDLLTFRRNKDFYAKAGKAWKRGYLLYGPPGTGKSTMVAAMANLLGYDVYDLELTAVMDNTELRRLLIDMTSKSILVIEDIDCSLDLTGQRKKKNENGESNNENKETIEEGDYTSKNSNSQITLSGLLNFIDGLWSACGSERLIVFTTNYVENLDPALIRRGRMDKHIELSYCSFEGFKVLAKNYLNLENHQMFDKIESLIEETKITPADVAENLMPKSPRDDPKRCLLNLIGALEEAKEAASKKKELIEDQSIEAQDKKVNGKLD